MQVKICDFGMAEVLDRERGTGTSSTLGTAAFLSPEIVSGSEYSGYVRTHYFPIFSK